MRRLLFHFHSTPEGGAKEGQQCGFYQLRSSRLVRIFPHGFPRSAVTSDQPWMMHFLGVASSAREIFSLYVPDFGKSLWMCG